MNLVELRHQLLRRAAASPCRWRAGDGVRVASLDHEARDDAVELDAVVEALLREVDEVLHVIRRGVGVEADVDLTGGGVQLRDLILVVLHRSILLGCSFRRGRRRGGDGVGNGRRGSAAVSRGRRAGGLGRVRRRAVAVRGCARRERGQQQCGDDGLQNKPPSYVGDVRRACYYYEG